MSRASADIMDLLHSLAATALTEELQRSVAASREPQQILVNDELVDNPAYAPLNPNLVDKALKMLKDNAITAPASNAPLHDLAAELTDLDLSNPAVSLRH